ncbi:MAG: biotin--[acetyl-CoA-carboxylase] ligase, partial [Flavobacteriaceae bacterium]|nr:biotin--[acetyl-CoA-carboxylase] ligase [Flavobacteriaceae bacterium]
GRNNNSWESEGGKNLTFSIILYPYFINVEQQFYISKAVSLGILDFIKSYADNASIKWPNDIYVNDKKISGILIENTIKGSNIESCVVGIGFNVNQTVFKGDAPNPTSLKLILKNDIDLNESLEKICGHIEGRYLQLQNENFSEIDNEYLLNLYRYNEFSSYESMGKEFVAKIVDIKHNGHLVLEDKAGNTSEYNLNELNFII